MSGHYGADMTDLMRKVEGLAAPGTPRESRKASLAVCAIAGDAATARTVLEALGLVESPIPAGRRSHRPAGGRQYAEAAREAS